MNDIRLEQLEKWLIQCPEIDDFDLTPASADASFRRYFRISIDQSSQKSSDIKSYIAMDAPPEKEDSSAFVSIAKILFDAGINVPKIYQSDFKLGFFLISDLGSEQYLTALNNSSEDKLYHSAIDTLIEIQKIPCNATTNVPNYDHELLMREMELFQEWYLERHRGVSLDSTQQTLLLNTLTFLSETALAQTQVLVHRDYHSRNIMTNKMDSSRPGILDFQDAVIGPFTYDLVSLLRDCYINWPEQQVIELALSYKKRAVQLEIIPQISNDDFIKFFDLMGIQRHLKAIGIFSRLNYRDNKSGYLNDIPRTLEYIKNSSNKYLELEEFNFLITNTI